MGLELGAAGAVVGPLEAGMVAGETGDGGGGEVVEERVAKVGESLASNRSCSRAPWGWSSPSRESWRSSNVLLVFVEDDVVVGEAAGAGDSCTPTY